MRYTLPTLQSELGKAVRKSIRMGYADGAGLYARMLARYVMDGLQSGAFRTDPELDLEWFMAQTDTRQRQVRSLVTALTASGRNASEALAIARAAMADVR